MTKRKENKQDVPKGSNKFLDCLKYVFVKNIKYKLLAVVVATACFLIVVALNAPV